MIAVLDYEDDLGLHPNKILPRKLVIIMVSVSNATGYLDSGLHRNVTLARNQCVKGLITLIKLID
jgi:hypothetical protein